jgi:hypothetical protein
MMPPLGARLLRCETSVAQKGAARDFPISHAVSGVSVEEPQASRFKSECRGSPSPRALFSEMGFRRQLWLKARSLRARWKQQ